MAEDSIIYNLTDNELIEVIESTTEYLFLGLPTQKRLKEDPLILSEKTRILINRYFNKPCWVNWNAFVGGIKDVMLATAIELNKRNQEKDIISSLSKDYNKERKDYQRL